MAVRKRFTKEERSVFTYGVSVEWLNGSHWQPGMVVVPPKLDEYGTWSVGVRNLANTRTVSSGQYITGCPGHVRIPKV
jgi:hypothetical protein